MMMNHFFKKIAIVTALFVPSTIAFGQDLHFTPVETGKYEAYMNFTGRVESKGVPLNDVEVAMFVGGECRQTQVSHNLSGIDLSGNPYSFDGMVAYYLAWGQTHKENITFKVFLPNGEERELAAICPLVVDSRTGMPSAPFILDIDKTAHTAIINFRQENPQEWTNSTNGKDGNQFKNEDSFKFDGLTIEVKDNKTTDAITNYINEEWGLRVAPSGTVTFKAPKGYVIIGAWPLSTTHRLVLDKTNAVFNYDGWSGNSESITITNNRTSTNNLYGIEVRYALADELELADDDRDEKSGESNADMISLFNGKTLKEVCLKGRTLFHNDVWNTLCVPFDLDGFTGTILEEAKVKELETASYSNNTLTLNFKDTEKIEAGKAYIVKWATSGENITDPVFSNVTIKEGITPTVIDDVVSFEGVYTPAIYEEGTAHKRTLFMKPDKKLYYPDGSAITQINAFRALFKLPERLICGEPDNENSIKAFVVNFNGEEAATAILDINGTIPMIVRDKWYDMTGRRLSSRPSSPGIYINNGHKILIRSKK